ncbi:unnamed protein product [Cunninghamella echinulata]
MVVEKESLLPIINEKIEKESLLPIIYEKIETNESNRIFDVEVGPRYEDNKWWWFLVTLLRIFICAISFILAHIITKYIAYFLNIQNIFLAISAFIIYWQIVFTLVLLLVSFVFGQFNFFYLFTYRSFIYKHILSRKYILNRIAAEVSSKSSS